MSIPIALYLAQQLNDMHPRESGIQLLMYNAADSLRDQHKKIAELELQVGLYQEDTERIWGLMPELRNTEAYEILHEAVHEKLYRLERKLAEQQAYILKLGNAKYENFTAGAEDSVFEELTKLLAEVRDNERKGIQSLVMEAYEKGRDEQRAEDEKEFDMILKG